MSPSPYKATRTGWQVDLQDGSPPRIVEVQGSEPRPLLLEKMPRPEKQFSDPRGEKGTS